MALTDTLKTISPVDGSIWVERACASEAGIASALTRAREAQAVWKHIVVEDRAAGREAAADTLVAKKDGVAEEIAWQMSRPMIAIAPEAPADVAVEPKGGVTRFIRREPVGVVLVVAPWRTSHLRPSPFQ